MAINLEEHKFFEFQRKMDVVPYSIAVRAVEEACDDKLDEALRKIENSLGEINKTISEND